MSGESMYPAQQHPMGSEVHAVGPPSLPELTGGPEVAAFDPTAAFVGLRDAYGQQEVTFRDANGVDHTGPLSTLLDRCPIDKASSPAMVDAFRTAAVGVLHESGVAVRPEYLSPPEREAAARDAVRAAREDTDPSSQPKQQTGSGPASTGDSQPASGGDDGVAEQGTAAPEAPVSVAPQSTGAEAPMVQPSPPITARFATPGQIRQRRTETVIAPVLAAPETPVAVLVADRPTAHHGTPEVPHTPTAHALQETAPPTGHEMMEPSVLSPEQVQPTLPEPLFIERAVANLQPLPAIMMLPEARPILSTPEQQVPQPQQVSAELVEHYATQHLLGERLAVQAETLPDAEAAVTIPPVAHLLESAWRLAQLRDDPNAPLEAIGRANEQMQQDATVALISLGMEVSQATLDALTPEVLLRPEIMAAMPDILAQADDRMATIIALQEKGLITAGLSPEMARAQVITEAVMQLSLALDRQVTMEAAPPTPETVSPAVYLPEVFAPLPATQAEQPPAIPQVPLRDRLRQHVQTLPSEQNVAAQPLVNEVAAIAHALVRASEAQLTPEQLEAYAQRMIMVARELLDTLGVPSTDERVDRFVRQLVASEAVSYQVEQALHSAEEGTHERKRTAVEHIGGMIGELATPFRAAGRLALKLQHHAFRRKAQAYRNRRAAPATA